MKLRPFLPLVALTLLSPLGIPIAQARSAAIVTLDESRSDLPALIAQQPEQPPFEFEEEGPGPWGPRGRRQERMRQVFQQLDLTSEQSQKIRDLRQQRRQAKQDLRQQRQAAHEQMRTLMAGNASDSELRQQYQQIQRLRQQMADQRFETMLQIRAELTPEQRAKMAQLKPQFGHHRRRFRSQ